MKKLLTAFFLVLSTFVLADEETTTVDYDQITAPATFNLIWRYRTETVGSVTYAIITGVRTSGSPNPVGNIIVPTSVIDGGTGQGYIVKKIDDGAFASQIGLTSVTLPSVIESVGTGTFAGCTILSAINVDSANQWLSSINGVLYDKTLKKLLVCPAAQTSLVLPETLQRIDDKAFASCASLVSVTYLCNEPTAPDDIYDDTPAELTSYVKKSAGFHISSTDTWKNRRIETEIPITVPVEVTVDGTVFTFNWEYKLDIDSATATLITVTPKPVNEIEVPNVIVWSIYGKTYSFAVTEIAANAFADARALTKATISASVEKIGDYTFSNCTALAEVKLSYGLRYIGKRPFVNAAISELTLPDTLLDMDGNIAAGAIYDMTLNISGSSHFTYSDDGVLYNKDMTKLYSCPTRAEGTITIPASVTNICTDAFFGCFRLTYLNIPAAVNAIGSGAFNVGGIWPGLRAPESTPKLMSVFYNGDTPAAPDDIYDGAPAELVSYVFTDGWGDPWKGRPVVVIDEQKPPVLSIKDDDGITWYYRILNGAVEIYNEDASGNAIAAISPQSTSGARYYEDKDSTTYRMALKVPNTINGYAVTRIGDHAFDGCKALTYIGIPASIEEIGSYAFKDCTAVRAVDYLTDTFPFSTTDGTIILPGGVTRLGSHPFEGMKASHVSIPYTVTEMDGNPLAGMGFVREAEVDAANPRFSSSGNVVYDKRKAKVVGVPSNYDGSSISFPPTVTEIGAEALLGCANLDAVTLPDALETISSNAFAGCSSLASLTIPATVAEIGSAAFTNCASLAKVTYAGNAPATPDDLYAGTPETLTSWIAEGATGFTEGTWRNRPVVVSGSGGGEDELSTTIGGTTWYFRVVDGVAEIWRKNSQTAIVCDEPILNLSLPETLGGYLVKGIGTCALSDLRGITSIAIPNTYEWIGDHAFSNCTSLASVSLGTGVERIGKRPFFGTKITELKIPDSVMEIDGNPVDGCRLMQAVSADDTQPYFSTDDGLLYDKKQETLVACPATKTAVNLPDTLKAISSGAFAGCSSLEAVSIPATVAEIGSAAFTNCASLAKVTYAGNAPATPDDLYAGTPETLTSWIAEGATGFTEGTWRNRPVVVGHDDELSTTIGGTTWYFRVVDGVAEIWRKNSQTAIVCDEPILNLSLPETLGGYLVKGIGTCALSNLRGITSIAIPSTYEWIDDFAFSNCTSLASASLGNGVKKIGKWPFYGTSLTSLEIPDGVSEIDGNPVAGCSMMQSVSVSDTQPYFSTDDGLLFDKGKATLIACPATKSTISLPDTLATINDDAFYGCNLLDDGRITIGDATWTFTVSDGKATITAVDGASGTVTIPRTLGTYPVADIADDAFADLDGVEEFVSESDAFSVRGKVLYTANGKELVRVPDTLILPYTEITSNATAVVVQTTEAGVSGGLPYVKTNSTVKAQKPSVSRKDIDGDVDFDSLLSGVTKIRAYAFAGVNLFEPSISTTTNGTVSGVAIPGDGKAYAYVTNTITIASVTYSCELELPSTIDADENAFTDSGITLKNARKSTRAQLHITVRDPASPETGPAESASQAKYDGFLVDANGNLVGSVEIKTARARNGKAKVSVTMQVVGGRKNTLKGELDLETGIVAGLDIKLTSDGISGKLDGYDMTGSRNRFASKQKDEASSATVSLKPWVGKVVNVAWPNGTMSATIMANGKYKVSGVVADGTKVAATGQLQTWRDCFCAPVIVAKKANLAFLLELPFDGSNAMVEGLDGAVVGKPGTLKPGATFNIDPYAVAALAGGFVDEATIPDGASVTISGTKLTVATGDAKSAPKLRYAAKTGSFSGSFKLRSNANGRASTTTVKVNGVLIGDIGYGFAMVKNRGSTLLLID